MAPRTFPALGFDPAPGLSDQVTALAAAVSGAAREVTEVRRTLESIGKAGGTWRGEAATAFSGQLGELPPYLDMATDANSRATGALTSWAHDLAGFQSQAADYERQAEAAKSRVDAARQTLRHYQGSSPGSDPAAADRLRQQTAEAQRAVSAADAALQEIVGRARQLAGRHQAALTATAATIRDAADAAPPEPGFWDKLGIGGLLASLTGYTNNAVVDGKLSTSDIPFSAWVPRSSTPAAAVLAGPAGVAFANYIGDGNELDAEANAEAERQKWIR